MICGSLRCHLRMSHKKTTVHSTEPKIASKVVRIGFKDGPQRGRACSFGQSLLSDVHPTFWLQTGFNSTINCFSLLDGSPVTTSSTQFVGAWRVIHGLSPFR